MPQSFRSLCFGFLEPLAHRALDYSEGCGDVFLFPSLFMQFPGTHPSSFAPIFGACRFLAHPSFYRHSTFFLYFSPLRSIEQEHAGQSSWGITTTVLEQPGIETLQTSLRGEPSQPSEAGSLPAPTACQR